MARLKHIRSIGRVLLSKHQRSWRVLSILSPSHRLRLHRIVHGQPGNYWNEHVNAALALWCTKEAFDQIRAFAEAKRADPGVYDLFSYNCLTFVIEALAQGGVSLEVGSGKRLRTFIPRGAFRRVSQVAGAHKLGAWNTGSPLLSRQKTDFEQSPTRLARIAR